MSVNMNVQSPSILTDPNILEKIPGMTLTEEQKEICRNQRELLAKRLRYIMVAQLVIALTNIVAGSIGIRYYDGAGFAMPVPVGNFIAGVALALSCLGAFGLRNSALNFDPSKKMTGCGFLALLQVPNALILFGAIFTGMAVALSSVFTICDEDASSFDKESCTSNPDAVQYKKAVIFSLVLLPVNIVMAITTIAIMCTSRKAFVTDQMAFNRPTMQTREQRLQALMLQHHMILQHATQQQQHQQQQQQMYA